MSRNSQHSGSGPEVPVILLVHRKVANLKKQTYKNIIIINSEDGTTAQFFQTGMEQHKVEGIYGFLSEYDYLAEEDAIEKVVGTLNNPFAAAIYTDSVIVAHNNIPQVFPPFCKHTYDFSIINTPLFVADNMLKTWDTTLQHAYFFDYFKQIGTKNMLKHIPEPLIATTYHEIPQEEIKKVQQKYGPSK